MKTPTEPSALQPPIPAMPEGGHLLDVRLGASCIPVIMAGKAVILAGKARRAKPRNVKTRR